MSNYEEESHTAKFVNLKISCQTNAIRFYFLTLSLNISKALFLFFWWNGTEKPVYNQSNYIKLHKCFTSLQCNVLTFPKSVIISGTMVWCCFTVGVVFLANNCSHSMLSSFPYTWTSVFEPSPYRMIFVCSTVYTGIW